MSLHGWKMVGMSDPPIPQVSGEDEPFMWTVLADTGAGDLIVLGAHDGGVATLLGMAAVETMASAGAEVLHWSTHERDGGRRQLLDDVSRARGAPVGRLSEHVRFWDAGKERPTFDALMDDLELWTRQRRGRRGRKVVVIDSLGKLQFDGGARAQEIGRLTSTLKAFAARSGSMVVLVAPTRARNSRMIDFEESGCLEDDADLMITVPAPTATTRVTDIHITVVKNRRGPAGHVIRW
jgi:hypothetical protein